VSYRQGCGTPYPRHHKEAERSLVPVSTDFTKGDHCDHGPLLQQLAQVSRNRLRTQQHERVRLARPLYQPGGHRKPDPPVGRPLTGCPVRITTPADDAGVFVPGSWTMSNFLPKEMVSLLSVGTTRLMATFRIRTGRASKFFDTQLAKVLSVARS
jgi:hypothetical protein